MIDNLETGSETIIGCERQRRTARIWQLALRELESAGPWSW